MTMRRSKTTAAVSHGQRSKIDMLNESFSSISSPRRSGSSSANASWENGATQRKPSFGRRSLQDATGGDGNSKKSLLLQNDDIDSLLKMLRTNEFAGKVDMEHHSRYMNEPTLAPAASPMKSSKKIMMRSSFQSDTHLLSLKGNQNAKMVPAWAQ